MFLIVASGISSYKNNLYQNNETAGGSLACLKMAAVRASRDATVCFQRCYKKLMVFTFKEDEETRASLNLLLDELIALDCNSFGISSEVNKNSFICWQ